MSKKPFLLFIFYFLLFQTTFSQTINKQWYLEDPQQDSVLGISIAKAYQFLKGKNFTPVIVAVIDGGIDTIQEDLKNILWTNTKEKPANNIDDDHNGYADDVHGWNFLGNKNGTDLSNAPGEKTRVYYHFKNKFAGKIINVDSLNEEERFQYNTWLKAAQEMTLTGEDEWEEKVMSQALKTLQKQDTILQNAMQKKEYSIGDVENFIPSNTEAKKAKYTYLTCMKMFQVTSDVTNTSILSDLAEETDGKKKDIEEKQNAPEDMRAKIIGDDYYNINDRYYGNNDVMGPSALHGTHVSGIIAAQRNNNIGIDGIADHVKIMMIRAVPDGDEYDKDIALAIRYAVDNGAKVINMSFGKYFSPEKKWVDDAVKYAEEKDVLLVHAAGNESKDVDTVANYPNDDLIFLHETATNFINVGASGDAHIADGKLIAYFSNYGAQGVDVFAPGIKIYSTLPGTSTYGYESGTSMAAPVVSGIAALIRSYYPQLTAVQVKEILIRSATQITDSSKILDPGTSKPTSMKNLCRAGGIVNAYAALRLADEVSKQLENKKSAFEIIKPN